MSLIAQKDLDYITLTHTRLWTDSFFPRSNHHFMGLVKVNPSCFEGEKRREGIFCFLSISLK